MSKQLYPKPRPAKTTVTRQREDPAKRPLHVEYVDPTGGLETEWGHYNSELGAKIGAWVTSVLVGFRPQATLYERNELEGHE